MDEGEKIKALQEMAQSVLRNLALAVLADSGRLGGRLPIELQGDARRETLAELLSPHILEASDRQMGELLRQAYFEGVLRQHDETAVPDQFTEDHFEA